MALMGAGDELRCFWTLVYRGMGNACDRMPQDSILGVLIAGALMFPVAVVHGTGSWFGAW